MSNIPEDLTIEVTCPACGKPSRQPLARLHREKQFSCPHDGIVRITDRGLQHIEEAVGNIDQRMAELSRTINIKL